VPPDLLVGRDGTTIAVRLPNGMLGFVGEVKDEFSAEAWLKRDGDERLPEDAMAARRDGLKCDAFGCAVRATSGARISVAFREEALAEDCARADVLVSLVGARGCNGPQLVIDRLDVLRDGTTAVWLGEGAPRVLTVQSERGDRPWSPPPRSMRYAKDQ